MARMEIDLKGSFDDWVYWLDNSLPEISATSTLEESIHREDGNIRVAIRTYERYIYLGKGRVSLNVVLIESANKLWLSATSTGGSQAMFFKLNYLGEDLFMEEFEKLLDIEIKKIDDKYSRI